MLEEAKKPLAYSGPPLEILLRDPKNSLEEYPKILSLITNNTSNKIVVGYIENEDAVGPVGEEWNSFVQKNKDIFELRDCSNNLNEFLAHKDPCEIDYLKISSKYCTYVMDNLIKKFENTIDQDEKVTHEGLSNEIKGLAEKPHFVKKFLDKTKINAELGDLELVFSPAIQSGGNYDLDILCGSNKNNLSSDVILIKVGTRYKDYNSIIVRSFMIDSDKTQQQNYRVLLESFNYMVSLMTEGAKMCEIYQKVVDFIKSKDENLVHRMPENFGYGVNYILNFRLDMKLKTPIKF
jgi:nucleosome binding factor SPN SPT16 subunit